MSSAERDTDCADLASSSMVAALASTTRALFSEVAATSSTDAAISVTLAAFSALAASSDLALLAAEAADLRHLLGSGGRLLYGRGEIFAACGDTCDPFGDIGGVHGDRSDALRDVARITGQPLDALGHLFAGGADLRDHRCRRVAARRKTHQPSRHFGRRGQQLFAGGGEILSIGSHASDRTRRLFHRHRACSPAASAKSWVSFRTVPMEPDTSRKAEVGILDPAQQ